LGSSSFASAINLELAGNYKNLYSIAKTFQGESYNLDLNRFRIQIQSQILPNLSLETQYDLEWYLGSFLKTAAFPDFRNYRPPTNFDLISPLIDTDNLYARQKLYRFYINFSTSAGDVKLGRQKIPWGTGKVWNPTDPFNPIAYTSLEREERAGVDAISYEMPISALSSLNLVYSQKPSLSTWGGRLRMHIGETDSSLLGVKMGDDYLLGFDFASQILAAGIYGEAAFNRSAGEPNFMQAVIGYDYTFPSSLYFMIEYYYNGQGKSNETDYQWNRWLSGEIANLARNYAFFGLTYDLSLRINCGSYYLYNIDDSSGFWNPFVEYSLTENASGLAGGYLVNGRSGSEFGYFSNIYYLQLRCFF
jgi:hypothetical protein